MTCPECGGCGWVVEVVPDHAPGHALNAETLGKALARLSMLEGDVHAAVRRMTVCFLAAVGTLKGNKLLDARCPKAQDPLADHAGRLWSLWDMLKVTATDYIKAGEAFAAIEPILDPPADGWFEQNAVLGLDETRFVFENLVKLENHCSVLQLQVSAGLVRQLVLRFDGSVGARSVTKKDAYLAMRGIAETFKVELDTRLFFYVLPHRAPYFGGDGGSPDNSGTEAANLLEALAPFPEASYDAREAATCFAFERFTASAYHLMRASEHGLVSVATAANVQPGACRSWDRMIAGIHAHINKLSSDKPVANWKDEEKKFSDLCSWFTVIRNGWRNPVSHVPRVFTEPTVRGMFAATRTLFEHLKANGFVSPLMPKTPIVLPDDSDDSNDV